MTQTTEYDSNTVDASQAPQPTQGYAGCESWENVEYPPKRSPFKFPRKKRVLTILLIGETGSGKTAFMSLLLNLLEGRGPFELEEKYFTDAQSGLDKTQSQTTDARLYSFTTEDGIKIQVLDTPGLADTRGIHEDMKHKDRIYNAIQDLIKKIDGIMIVANGRIERLTAATDYTLNILATLFPRSIVKNIGILYTNIGAGGAGFNFQQKSLPAQLQKAKYWLLDNPLSLHRNYQAQVAKGELSQKRVFWQERNIMESYEDTIESLDKWFEWLDEREAVPTTAIIEAYQKSTDIESRLFAAMQSIDSLSELESKLQITSSNLGSAGKEKERLTALLTNEPPKVWKMEETACYNTICAASDCRTNCHSQCSLELGDPEAIGQWCRVFKTLWIANRLIPFKCPLDVNCGSCGHAAALHRNYKKAHIQVSSNAYEMIAQEVSNAATTEKMFGAAKVRVEKEIEEIKRQIAQYKRDIPDLIDELNQVSLSPNYAGYIESAIQLFKLRKKLLESRPGSGEELDLVNKGIKTFEGQLELLRENEAGRIVAASGEFVGS
ncbi:unnamed protein product [Rhizoctonia solani]|uniref:AIG1-type G domain-containing protein n=1 Tax=Rhizoctonia solani TaxID=456999 RepID=A0A8H3E2D9_9AGAM|nr:unnamed protein product [Rhizoctonia solani]